MKISLSQTLPSKEVKTPEEAKSTEPGNTAIEGKTAAATAGQKKTRRVPHPRPQHATHLDTADDDEYDDCWLAEYEDPRPTDKVVDDWVRVKKPASGR